MFNWCSSKPCWRSILTRSYNAYNVWRSHQNRKIVSSSGSHISDAKRCESIAIVALVRFQCLETLFLSSDSLCEAFRASHNQSALKHQKYVFCRANNLVTAGRGTPTPTNPPPQRTRLKRFGAGTISLTERNKIGCSEGLWNHLRRIIVVPKTKF